MTDIPREFSAPRQRRSGARRSPIPAHDLSELTTREREVLAWLAESKRDAEIATILGVSLPTVRKHVQHILKKLEVENRTAAACIAVEARCRAGADVETPKQRRRTAKPR